MPWESKKQQRWGHGRGGKKAGFTPEKIKEWDKKTDFESIPEEAACGLSLSDCTESACAEYATCQKKATASMGACGVAVSDCAEVACCKTGTCQQATASVGACGVAVSDCAEVACCKTGTCQQAMAYTLSWGPRQLMLVEELNWTGAADSAEARPCTEGDDDSQYGPRGDDQKCTDEGIEDYDRQEEDYYSGREEEIPEGFQEVDMGDPSMDPEGGDWESLLDEEPEEEMDVKKTMKEEEKVEKEEQKTQEKTSKEQSRTAISIPRDPNLDPNAFHQFWDPSHTGHSGMDEQRNYTLQKSVEILEERMNNPRSPEDAEAARSILMNGPKAGGAYQKTKKAEPGEPGAEDFYQKEDRSPII
jgi:hypothetical protein